jgi:hypothetical protein
MLVHSQTGPLRHPLNLMELSLGQVLKMVCYFLALHDLKLTLSQAWEEVLLQCHLNVQKMLKQWALDLQYISSSVQLKRYSWLSY